MHQNLTVRLSTETIRKAKLLAARRSTSVSGLVAAQIEALAAEEDAYQRAARQAHALFAQTFHLGGVRTTRDSLHER
jgi:hypothetical protein